jgi:hypothetical protein
MKKFSILIGCVIVIAITTININVLSTNTAVAQAPTPPVDPGAAGEVVSDWWNSKVYECQREECSIQIFITTYNGHYENCEGGSSVAHCWECKSCDAG